MKARTIIKLLSLVATVALIASALVHLNSQDTPKPTVNTDPPTNNDGEVIEKPLKAIEALGGDLVVEAMKGSPRIDVRVGRQFSADSRTRTLNSDEAFDVVNLLVTHDGYRNGWGIPYKPTPEMTLTFVGGNDDPVQLVFDVLREHFTWMDIRFGETTVKRNVLCGDEVREMVLRLMKSTSPKEAE